MAGLPVGLLSPLLRLASRDWVERVAGMLRRGRDWRGCVGLGGEGTQRLEANCEVEGGQHACSQAEYTQLCAQTGAQQNIDSPGEPAHCLPRPSGKISRLAALGVRHGGWRDQQEGGLEGREASQPFHD